MQVKSCCFANLNLMPFFAVLVAVAFVVRYETDDFYAI